MLMWVLRRFICGGMIVIRWGFVEGGEERDVGVSCFVLCGLRIYRFVAVGLEKCIKVGGCA